MELNIEFSNWASAVEIVLGLGHGDSVSQIVRHLSMLKLMIIIHKGVLEDPSRLRIIAVFWERALVVLLREIENIQVKPQASGGSWFGLDNLFGTPAQADRVSPGILARILLQSCAACMALQLVSHNHSHNKTRSHQPYITIASDIIRDMKATTLPEGKYNEIRHRNVTTLEMLLMMILHYDTMTEEVFCKARDELFRNCIDVINLNGGTEAYPDSLKSWHDIPVSLNSASAMNAHLTTAVEIQAAIDSEDFGAARRLIDQTLFWEMNKAGNDKENIALLRQWRCEIDEKEGNSEGNQGVTNTEGITEI
jgi:hypothetical protein